MEPDNVKEKYAVAVLKEGEVVGHLMKGQNYKFAKTIFYSLRSDSFHTCEVKVAGKPVNKGDMMGMRVRCKLHLSGRKHFVDKLNQLVTKM